MGAAIPRRWQAASRCCVSAKASSVGIAPASHGLALPLAHRPPANQIGLPAGAAPLATVPAVARHLEFRCQTGAGPRTGISGIGVSAQPMHEAAAPGHHFIQTRDRQLNQLGHIRLIQKGAAQRNRAQVFFVARFETRQALLRINLAKDQIVGQYHAVQTIRQRMRRVGRDQQEVIACPYLLT